MALKICTVPVERKIPQNCHPGCNESDGRTALVSKAFQECIGIEIDLPGGKRGLRLARSDAGQPLGENAISPLGRIPYEYPQPDNQARFPAAPMQSHLLVSSLVRQKTWID